MTGRCTYPGCINAAPCPYPVHVAFVERYGPTPLEQVAALRAEVEHVRAALFQMQNAAIYLAKNDAEKEAALKACVETLKRVERSPLWVDVLEVARTIALGEKAVGQ